MRAVGSSLPRFDIQDKVTGRALYPGDINMPGQLYMKILWPGEVPARITRFDVSRAESAPGVAAVLSAKDAPVNEYGLIMPDQEVLCGREGGLVRSVIDQVALVVAESEEQATAALALIDIEYEPLPGVYSIEEALAPDAPVVHPEKGNDNVLLSYKIRLGDVENAFAEADVIVERTYRTHPQEHAYLQPEAGLGFVRPDGKIEIIVGGQWMHEDRQQIAHALDLPEEQIVVRYPAIGGAFGGREDMSVQIILALAAQKTGRPVKIQWTRQESLRGHHKRHGMVAHAKWAATKEGKVIAAETDFTLDAGAYAYTSTKVLGNATLASLGPYEIPNVRVDSRTVYTNNIAAGAFRGFGGPQGHFIAEMQMAYLAEALDMDPVELRMKNLWHEGSKLATRSVLPAGVTVRETLAACAKNAGWAQTDDGWQRPSPQQNPAKITPLHQAFSLDATRGRKARGIGIATSYKNVGFSLGYVDESWATVELHGSSAIERVVVHHAGADVGQGAHTVMRQFAADFAGAPLENVELIADDTEHTQNSGSTSASRMTFMAGNAIRGAAEAALQLWRQEERPAIATYRFVPRATTPYDHETGEADPNITYGYCTQAAEVEVDLDTGRITVLNLWNVTDVGKAVNPQMVQGQIYGAVAQSVGWVLMEELKYGRGQVLTDKLSTYLVPTVLDTAIHVDPGFLELPDPQGPMGARGMAEMPFIPTAPAIIAALHDATGMWFDELPLTPERVAMKLQEAKRYQ